MFTQNTCQMYCWGGVLLILTACENLYRVSDTINIEFSLNTSYTFNKFKIIDKDTKEEDTSAAITFFNKKSIFRRQVIFLSC